MLPSSTGMKHGLSPKGGSKNNGSDAEQLPSYDLLLGKFAGPLQPTHNLVEKCRKATSENPRPQHPNVLQDSPVPP